MQTLLLGMGGRASPSVPSILSQDGLTEVSAGFDVPLLPLMLVIAVAAGISLKIIELTIKAMVRTVKSIAETALAFVGLLGAVVLIILVMAVMLRFPT